MLKKNFVFVSNKFKTTNSIVQRIRIQTLWIQSSTSEWAFSDTVVFLALAGQYSVLLWLLQKVSPETRWAPSSLWYSPEIKIWMLVHVSCDEHRMSFFIALPSLLSWWVRGPVCREGGSYFKKYPVMFEIHVCDLGDNRGPCGGWTKDWFLSLSHACGLRGALEIIYRDRNR